MTGNEQGKALFGGLIFITSVFFGAGGCNTCEWLSGPTAMLRLEYEIVVDETLRQRANVDGEPRNAVVDATMSQTREVVARRVEELGIRRARVDVRGTRLIVDLPVHAEGQYDLILDVRRSLSRAGRLEFRIADDQERALYERLQPMVSQDDVVELVPEDQSFFLRASDRRANDGAIIPGARAIETLVGRAHAAGFELPSDRELLMENITPRAPDGSAGAPREQVWRSYLVSREAVLTGDHVRDARAVTEDFGPEAGRPYVTIEFDERGRQIFGDVTAANVRKRLAIVVDSEVTSAPVIQEAIRGGRARITLGEFMGTEALEAEARTLVVALRSGALPAPLTLVSETVIAPPSKQ